MLQALQISALAAGMAANASAMPPGAPPRLGEPRALTAEGAPFLVSPAWSPDGRLLACGGERWTGLHLVDPASGAVRTLTSAPGAGYHFAWSPDSKHLASRCGSEPADGQRLWTIRVFDAETGAAKDGSGALRDLKWPVWSFNAEGWMCLEFAAGGKRQTLPYCVADKSSAPAAGSARFLTGLDNEMLHYADRRVCIFPAAGEALRPLSESGCFDPVWSPDRKQILWQRMDMLVIAARNGSGPRDLGPAIHPAWSPDGKWIVAQITADHTHAGEDARTHGLSTAPHQHDDKTNHRIVESDLIAIRVETGERFALTSTKDMLECDPCFSPDGKRLVWRTEDSGKLFMAEVTW